jgi:hypothetical protein
MALKRSAHNVIRAYLKWRHIPLLTELDHLVRYTTNIPRLRRFAPSRVATPDGSRVVSTHGILFSSAIRRGATIEMPTRDLSASSVSSCEFQIGQPTPINQH